MTRENMTVVNRENLVSSGKVHMRQYAGAEPVPRRSRERKGENP